MKQGIFIPQGFDDEISILKVSVQQYLAQLAQRKGENEEV